MTIKRNKDRNWYYKILRVGMRDLGMSEDAYREMLLGIGAKLKNGKPSASTMSIPQLERAVSHMKQCGFKPRPSCKRVDFKDSQIQKCKAIWEKLFEAGVMHKPYSEATLSKWAFRITQVNNIRWANSQALSKTIEGLKAAARRERVNLEPNRDC